MILYFLAVGFVYGIVGEINIKYEGIVSEEIPNHNLTYNNNIIASLRVAGIKTECPVEPEYKCEFHTLPMFAVFNGILYFIINSPYSYLILNLSFGFGAFLIFYTITKSYKLTLVFLLIPEFIILTLLPQQESYLLFFTLLPLWLIKKEKYNSAMIFSSASILARAILIIPIAFLFYLIINKKFKISHLIYPIIFGMLFLSYYAYFYNDYFYYFKTQAYLFTGTDKTTPNLLVFVQCYTYLFLSIFGVFLIKRNYNIKDIELILPAAMLIFYLSIVGLYPHIFSNSFRYFFTILPFVLPGFKKIIDKLFKYLLPPQALLWFLRVMFALKW